MSIFRKKSFNETSQSFFRKIELFLSCRELQNTSNCTSDTYIIIQSNNYPTNIYSEIHRTSIIKDNLNPNFSESCIIEYKFE